MIEVSTHELIAERTPRMSGQSRRSTVRSAVNAIAQRRSVQPRQVVTHEGALSTRWLMLATQCDAAAAAIAIKVTPGSAVGRETLIPGYLFRRFTGTTDRTIIALERLRTNGLVSWKRAGDGFLLVPHLH
jgi:hypothetical protein